MAFPSKNGCPMCSIVSRATESAPPTPISPAAPNSPISPSLSTYAASSRSSARSRTAGKTKDEPPEILWRDEHFTVVREHARPVSSIVHLVIMFNLHVPSLYMLSTSDVPLLVQLKELAYRLLTELTTSSGPSLLRSSPSSSSLLPASPISPFPFSSASASTSPSTSASPTPPSRSATDQRMQADTAADVDVSQFRVGFITPPWKDPSIPVKDHLHAHAFVAPMDRCSWWRSVAYSPLAWYAVEDLIAEIREESSNNRIRSSTISSSPAPAPVRGSSSSTITGSSSSYAQRLRPRPRPIDSVPNAGARSGTADGHETTCESLSALTDLEGGRRSGSGSHRSSTGSNFAFAYKPYKSYRRNGTEGPSSSRTHLQLSPLSPSFPGSSAGAGGSSTLTPTKSSFGTRSETSHPGSSIATTRELLSTSYRP